MPRRNLAILFFAAVIALACYQKADSAHRSRYGRMFDTFVEILEKVESRYVEPVEDRELFEGALKGMVHELGDPNCAYYNPHAAGLSRASLEQRFGGIGIEVLFDRATRQLTIVTPLVGSPAHEGGLLAGDRILEINGHSTDEFTLDDATRQLRGAPGTPVTLKVLHEGASEPVEVHLRRAIIKTDTVLGDRRAADGSWEYFLPEAPSIAYLRIALFGKNTATELRAVLDKLRAQGMRGLVLDLRNNGGGLLSAAEETCNLFIREGTIVSTRGRGGELLDVREADGSGPFADVPMAVLINHLSASASEIVAACLQDHQRATIVGTRSFGKGTVQDVILLEDGKSELRLTIATYWRPSGRNIHRSKNAQDADAWGVSPDAGYEIKLSDQQWSDILAQRRAREAVPRRSEAKPPESRIDPQLVAAIEAVAEKLRAERSP